MDANGKKSGGGSGRIVTDPRFAALHHDPRFQKFPKNKTKVEIDARFSGMFNDPDFKLPAGVDKRGRKVSGTKVTEDMRRYYRLRAAEAEEEAALETGGSVRHAAGTSQDGAAHRNLVGRGVVDAASDDDDDEVDAGARGSGTESDAATHSEAASESESSADDAEAAEEAAARERWARLRGLSGVEESSSDEDEPGLSDADEGSAGDAGTAVEPVVTEWGVGAYAANPEEDIPLLPDATARLAVVDLDWSNVSAVDILAVLRSFGGSGGSGVQRVTVYPSDYGLERMAAEAQAGPQGIYTGPGDSARMGQHAPGPRGGRADGDDGGDSGGSGVDEGGSDSDGSGEEDGSDGEDDSGAEMVRAAARGSARREPEAVPESALDRERLRQYERSRLRYYYAIVECASAAVASRVYDECDGIEFLKTACKFDLRFVPDGQSFDGRAVRDTATHVPSDYVPPVFQTKALQNTNVDLTWDEVDTGRRRVLHKRMTADDIKDDDFRAYLATSSDEDGGVEDGAVPQRHAAATAACEPRPAPDAAALREKYRALLLADGDGGASRGKRGAARDVEAEGSASDSSADEEDAEAGGAPHGTAQSERDRGMEMEVTFDAGLDSLGDRLLAKRDRKKKSQQEETVWEAYVRRRRERRAAAKKLGKHNIDSDDEDEGDGGASASSDDEGNRPRGVADDPFFKHDDDPFSDPFFVTAGEGGAFSKAPSAGRGSDSRGGKKDRRGAGTRPALSPEEQTAEAARRAELELLMMDDDGILSPDGTMAHADSDAREGASSLRSQGRGRGAAPKLTRRERLAAKKEARRQARTQESDDEGGVPADFEPNLDDARFGELLTSSAFALDPTDPRFDARAAALSSSLAARRAAIAKAPRDGGEAGAQRRASGCRPAPSMAQDQGDGAALRAMVASLKRKKDKHRSVEHAELKRARRGDKPVKQRAKLRSG